MYKDWEFLNRESLPVLACGIVWKEFSFELSPIAMGIYNASLIQGYVPDPLKQSEVVPASKCFIANSFEQDLRPITLTSHLRRSWRASLCLLFWIKSVINLIFNQFALAGKSTTHALHVLLHTLDQGDRHARAFFADFSKGFDLVDHNYLIQEMCCLIQEIQLLRVHEATIRWISQVLARSCKFVSSVLD